MFYYTHNNNNYQCKMCWNKALTFGVGSINLSFRAIVFTQYMHANMFTIQMLHFSQIVLRVCTLVLFIQREIMVQVSALHCCQLRILNITILVKALRDDPDLAQLDSTIVLKCYKPCTLFLAVITCSFTVK